MNMEQCMVGHSQFCAASIPQLCWSSTPTIKRRCLYDAEKTLEGKLVTLRVTHSKTIAVRFTTKWHIWPVEQPDKLYKVISLLPGRHTMKHTGRVLLEAVHGIPFRMIVNAFDLEEHKKIHNDFVNENL